MNNDYYKNISLLSKNALQTILYKSDIEFDKDMGKKELVDFIYKLSLDPIRGSQIKQFITQRNYNREPNRRIDQMIRPSNDYYQDSKTPMLTNPKHEREEPEKFSDRFDNMKDNSQNSNRNLNRKQSFHQQEGCTNSPISNYPKNIGTLNPFSKQNMSNIERGYQYPPNQNQYDYPLSKKGLKNIDSVPYNSYINGKDFQQNNNTVNLNKNNKIIKFSMRGSETDTESVIPKRKFLSTKAYFLSLFIISAILLFGYLYVFYETRKETWEYPIEIVKSLGRNFYRIFISYGLYSWPIVILIIVLSIKLKKKMIKEILEDLQRTLREIRKKNPDDFKAGMTEEEIIQKYANKYNMSEDKFRIEVFPIIKKLKGKYDIKDTPDHKWQINTYSLSNE